MKTIELFEHDLKYSPLRIAGVDEVGRGPLAGPVVVACCIMPLDKCIDKINDSKKVSEKVREYLFDEIIKAAICYNISIVDHDVIDSINILKATKLAMKNSIDGMNVVPDLVLIDAVDGLDVNVKCESIVKGDSLSYNIAAASILAKVTRDRLMREYDLKYSGYGFAQNKGYGTREHIQALYNIGACEIHRNSFIKNFDIKGKKYEHHN